jgi:hypothetical protein
MWCRDCRQDVRATTTSGEAKYCCPRCGQDLFAGVEEQGSGFGVQGSGPDAPHSDQSLPLDPLPDSISTSEARTKETDLFDACFNFDTWEMDEHLRHIQRVLGFEKGLARRRSAKARPEAARIDTAHAGLPLPGTPHLRAASDRNSAPIAAGRTGGGALSTFCLVSAGAMLVCGGVLLGESYWGSRPELWQIGLPITLVGQIVLVLGLLLRLNRLHHEQHAAAKKITSVDRELSRLRTATLRRESAHESVGGAFSTQNVHADPRSMLGDLETQLNRLARKIAEHAD